MTEKTFIKRNNYKKATPGEIYVFKTLTLEDKKKICEDLEIMRATDVAIKYKINIGHVSHVRVSYAEHVQEQNQKNCKQHEFDKYGHNASQIFYKCIHCGFLEFKTMNPVYVKQDEESLSLFAEIEEAMSAEYREFFDYEAWDEESGIKFIKKLQSILKKVSK